MVKGETVRQLIDELERKFPGIRDRLCVDGQLKPGIAVAIDSRISSIGLVETVGADSEVHFVPTVSGG